jgi:CRP-like cAMP-binding protein
MTTRPRHATSAAAPRIYSMDFANDADPPLARKLAQRAALGRDDLDHLARVLAQNVARFGNRVPVIEAGEAPGSIDVVLEGWAARYRIGPNGRRQILAFHLPGDVCEFNAFLMKGADASVEAIEGLRLARIGRSTLNQVAQTHPAITRGLWWESLGSASVAREWMVSLAQRNAHQRIAHLMCELFVRLRVVGCTEGDRASFPLTQADIGDACGMTPEHTNRTLRELRTRGLCSTQDRMLEIADWDGLAALAGFDPGYLHFDREIERLAETMPTGGGGIGAGVSLAPAV